MEHSFVDRVVDDRSDTGSPPQGGIPFGLHSVIVQVLSNPVRAVALFNHQVVDLPDYRRFFLVNDQIRHRLVPLVYPSQFYKIIAVRNRAAAPEPFLDHLAVLCPHTDGGLFTLAGSLPKPDVVHQLVNVGVEALLTFPGAPNLDALLNKPLYYEWSFIITAA